MKDKTLHMIGNAHLDPVWLWRWQEGFQEAKATFRSVLDRMTESEDFLFTSSSAAIYEWVERNDPRMFEEIRERIAQGRWQIVGGWWIQPDCNIPGGESFVRQGLYGQRYFKEKFGVTATVGYNVDSFGHHGMLPQILRKSGMHAYVLTRPEPYEKGLPGRVFWWESDDGSRVLAFRIPYEYSTWGKDLEKYVRRCIGELKPPFDTIMCFYGVGNHGGGPTRENLESIRRMSGDPALPTLVFSTPNQFFGNLLSRSLPFPIVHDDLQHHASGCYAVHSGIKRWNRQAENLLLTAEKFAALAERITGQPYPADLAQAWKNVLFNQFHDILGGTSIEAAYEDARDMHGEAMSIAGRGLNYAIQSLAWNIDIPHEEDMKPIVVFNQHAWPVRAGVEVELSGLKESDLLLDEAGAPLPAQLARPSAIVSGWRKRLCFLADLPPLGYRVYRVVPQALTPAPLVLAAVPQALPPDPSPRPGEGQASGGDAGSPPSPYGMGEGGRGGEGLHAAGTPPSPYGMGEGGRGGEGLHAAGSPPSPYGMGEGGRGGEGLHADDTTLENDRFRLTFDPVTGHIAGLHDKRHQLEVLLGAARPVVHDDPSDTWGHGVYQFHSPAGAFVAQSVRLIEHGPVKATIRVESAYGDSRLAQEFTMYRDLDPIEVRVTVDWREQFKLLKLTFPLNLNFLRATYEIPYGHIERPTNGEEEPGQSWVDLSGVTRGVEVPYGLSLLNDGKYSFDVRGRELSMTVLRSPIYAHHHPTLPRPGEPYTFVDQGIQHFSYALLPHEGGWEQAGTVRRAAELNQRPITLVETYHPGPLPQRASYLAVDQENIVVSVVKRAEDSYDTVIRCYETSKVATRATIRLLHWGRTIEADFGPCEIKTFRIPGDATLPVVETDLIEWAA